MSTESLHDELRLLQRALPIIPMRTVVVISSPPLPFAEAVAQHFTESRVYVVLQNVQDADCAESLAAYANATIRTTLSLSFLEQPADLVVVRSTPFEGTDRLRARLSDAHRHLNADGLLILVTAKNRGAKGHLKLLEAVFGNAQVVERGRRGTRIFTAQKSTARDSLPPTSETTITANVLDQTLTFRTAAGVFSKDRLDQGTRFLLEQFKDLQGPSHILDLGCGYGPLGIALARRFPKAQVTLVDVDLVAVRLAKSNAALNQVTHNTTVLLNTELQDTLPARFDLVVSHLPLHISRDAFTRMLANVSDCMLAGGQIVGVALCEYDVRPMLKRVFGNVETVAETDVDHDGPSYRIVRSVKTTTYDPSRT